MPDPSRDAQIRAAVFAFLTEQTSRLGEVLPWSVLTSGFVLDGKPVPLLGAAGIWNPAVLPELPLSIATAPPVEGAPRPYDDGIDTHGLLTYRYRGTDPAHRDNVGPHHPGRSPEGRAGRPEWPGPLQAPPRRVRPAHPSGSDRTWWWRSGRTSWRRSTGRC